MRQMKAMSRVPQAVRNPPPIALLAGRGTLPVLLIETFQSQKRPFVVLAFTGQTDSSLVETCPHVWVGFGEIGKAHAYLKENKIQEIVMAGAMTRPKMSEIRPDWEGMKWMAKIVAQSIGDDNLLRAVIGMVEANGYRVVAPDDLLDGLLTIEGTLTACVPDDQAWRDIHQGVKILETLSELDIGQAVIVQDGCVLGIEAVEGTDGLIRRTCPGGILVKMAKKQQERRVDLPTIGPETVKAGIASGLRGIAVEAGKSLLLNREETVRLANENGLFIVGVGQISCQKNP